MNDKFVRIKNPDTGHEETVPKAFAVAYKLEVLDKEAVDANGRPLPSKPKVNLPTADAKADTTTKSGGAAR